MKSFIQLLSFGLLSTRASAIPQAHKRQDVVYSLTVATKGDDSLNGEVVEISNNILGVYTGDRAPAEVYPIAEPSGFFSLHTFPIGIIDHVLGLKGDNDLYSLVDLVAGSDGLEGSNYDNFILEDGLVTQDIEGGWIAFPSADGWTIEWYDGTAIIPQIYVTVDLVYKSKEGY